MKNFNAITSPAIGHQREEIGISSYTSAHEEAGVCDGVFPQSFLQAKQVRKPHLLLTGLHHFCGLYIFSKSCMFFVAAKTVHNRCIGA